MKIGDMVNLSLCVPMPTFRCTGPRFKNQYTSVSGVVTEFVSIENDKFVILDGDKGVNLSYVVEE